MWYRKIDCPTCGNKITARGVKNVQKCPYCKRFFTVDVKKIKGKKYKFEASALDVAVTHGGIEGGR